MITPLAALCLVGLLQVETPTPAPAAAEAAPTTEMVGMSRGPEIAINITLENMRKAELLLDATAFDPYLAASVTFLEGGYRISGSFAYLESMRRMRERGGMVKTLTFSDVLPRVYGDAAVVTYQYDKVWVDGGARRRESGWCTDVLVNRDEGWVLVERHRGR